MKSAFTTVTHLLHRAAGSPPGAGDTPGTCCVCGLPGVGLSFGDWVRRTFTDWDKLVPGDILCQPCQFSFCERSELLAARVGKEKPQRMRNYSHFVAGGEWVPLSKGDKARMAHILLYESPEVAVIAQSGQKHILPWAVPGTVQFELTCIRDRHGLGPLLAKIETLYDGGLSKGEIETGDYAQHRVLRFGTALWRELEAELRPMRGTALFALALFLAQKTEKGEGDDTGITDKGAQDVRGAAGDHLARDTDGLQSPLCTGDMAAVPGGSGIERLHERREPEHVRQLPLL
jgi:hypothetical protein